MNFLRIPRATEGVEETLIINLDQLAWANYSPSYNLPGGGAQVDAHLDLYFGGERHTLYKENAERAWAQLEKVWGVGP